MPTESERLAGLFFKLRGSPREYANKAEAWARDFQPIEMTYDFDEFKAALKWAMNEDTFWPTRLFVPKNVVDNAQTIIDQHRGTLRARENAARREKACEHQFDWDAAQFLIECKLCRLNCFHNDVDPKTFACNTCGYFNDWVYYLTTRKPGEKYPAKAPPPPPEYFTHPLAWRLAEDDPLDLL